MEEKMTKEEILEILADIIEELSSISDDYVYKYGYLESMIQIILEKEFYSRERL